MPASGLESVCCLVGRSCTAAAFVRSVRRRSIYAGPHRLPGRLVELSLPVGHDGFSGVLGGPGPQDRVVSGTLGQPGFEAFPAPGRVVQDRDESDTSAGQRGESRVDDGEPSATFRCTSRNADVLRGVLGRPPDHGPDPPGPVDADERPIRSTCVTGAEQ